MRRTADADAGRTNAAWLAFNVIAHNLCKWLARVAGLALQCLKTLRHRLIAIPGRLVRSGRRLQLRLPEEWPWERQFLDALKRLRTVTPPTLA